MSFAYECVMLLLLVLRLMFCYRRTIIYLHKPRVTTTTLVSLWAIERYAATAANDFAICRAAITIISQWPLELSNEVPQARNDKDAKFVLNVVIVPIVPCPFILRLILPQAADESDDGIA